MTVQPPLLAEVLRSAPTLESQLLSTPPLEIARIARERGDAKRGAVIFFTSPAGCVQCHMDDGQRAVIGPNLAETKYVDDRHLVESLTHPSRSIRKGYETHYLLMDDGTSHTGQIAKETDVDLTLIPTSSSGAALTLRKDQIEGRKILDTSGMPDGLLTTFREQRDFMDLLKYLIMISEGGEETALQLQPSPAAISVVDDSKDLDHATIIRKFRSRDFETGERIFQGYCFGCHGRDGNQPSLPTARAFGTEKMKFGSDPFSMFQTLTRGNGLMAPMRHLTPKERYQVIHYLREAFMKRSNPDYFVVNDQYLESLPRGTQLGDERPEVERDFKPALGSQLRREYSSVLNIPLGKYSIAYNLHTMDIASVWEGDFLDVSETQHARDRGEGTVNPKGIESNLLSGWKWGHDEEVDYPTENLLSRGPLPNNWMRYKGYYQYDHQIVLSYEIDGRAILESPVAEKEGLTQHLLVESGNAITLVIASPEKEGVARSWISTKETTQTHVKLGQEKDEIAVLLVENSGQSHPILGCRLSGETENLLLSIDSKNRVVLSIPKSSEPRKLSITRVVGKTNGDADQIAEFLESVPSPKAGIDLPSLTRGGNVQWPTVLETKGYLGLEQSGYAVDTLTLPDSNPWNSWLRTTALDFFSDGRMAVSTYGGDIWLVDGVDESLTKLRWKRFAAGLYEPFGLRIVADQIYVTCKDRLVRLHDLNQDDEADFYESFSADPDVSVNFHAFNFDLQTDEEGNFYYAKSGHGSDSKLPGTIYKISNDGKQREVFSTGFRTPNGLGMMPGNRLVGSDNQGQWMPASKINYLKPDTFYGWVPNYSIPGMWEPDGGKVDLEKVVPPTSFEKPIVWMPQEFDNSSGGQHWVEDKRFGPLHDHLLHTSFGKGWMSYLMTQEIEDVLQGAIVRLPLNFRTGVMRARTNPRDGQVYTTGLQGWNGGGRIGLEDNGIQRLRYTGKAALMLVDCKVIRGGLQLTFNEKINSDSCQDSEAFTLKHWNYHWQKSYGSAQYRPSDDQVGVESLQVEEVKVHSNQRTIDISVPDLRPVDQLHLILQIESAEGEDFAEEIYWTIHRILHQ